jgi:hypothetical protein
MDKLAKKIINHMYHRRWEFRLFKKSVRKFVDDETHRKICDDYNREVTKYRSQK